MKRLIQNLGLLLACLCLIFVIFEVFLRISWFKPSYFYPQYLFIADGELGYRLKPNFRGEQNMGEFRVQIDINSQGLRDGEQPRSNNSEFRILGLGDSFTFGSGVELHYTYLNRLEEMLNIQNAATQDVEVINAGIPGYGTVEELEYLKKEGFGYNPNLVILGFYVGNDPYDNIKTKRSVKNGF